MRIIKRRRVAVVVLVFLAGLAAGLLAIVSAVADQERVAAYWINAELDDDGLHVTEIIDYDFGVLQRRGIFRDVPDLVDGSVVVSSDSAPDDLTLIALPSGTRIRIGNPAITIDGRHRYRIDYTLRYDAVVTASGFAWDAIGLEWNVPIEDAEIHLALPFELQAPSCQVGSLFDNGPCSTRSPGPGRIDIAVSGLDANNGLTLSGLPGPAEAVAPLPAVPVDTPSDPGGGLLLPALLTAAGFLLGGLVATVFVRRAGRERVWTGDPADAAFAEADEGRGSRRVDERDLADLATIEFVPPSGVSAVTGALLLHERVNHEIKTAWFLEAAISDTIQISGNDDPAITRGSTPPSPAQVSVLDTIFDGRSAVVLDEYDADFAKGWNQVGGQLDDWLDRGSWWDWSSRSRTTAAKILGFLVALAGIAVAGVAAVFAAKEGGTWLWVIAGASAVAGAAAATLVNAFELLVRTEEGSALWLRIESFRRFLEHSEAYHVDFAAERGLLREYTAWAVALGEARAWNAAIEDAASLNPDRWAGWESERAFSTTGLGFASAARTTIRPPSSSGSGGGFSGGGSIGGGGGGGGGGSW